MLFAHCAVVVWLVICSHSAGMLLGDLLTFGTVQYAQRPTSDLCTNMFWLLNVTRLMQAIHVLVLQPELNVGPVF